MIPPDPLESRFGLAIVAIVKDESKYIGEWSKFHYLGGVRHFYIYDNGSTDETSEVLHRTLPLEALTIIPWKQSIGLLFPQNTVVHNQVLAYAHAASNFGGHFRWMAFIDIDEFLVPKKHDSINEALSELSSLSNISLPWHMFGTNGHKTSPNRSVLESYIQRYRPLDERDRGMMNFKCVVDPCKLTGVRVHSMQTSGSWLTSNDRGEVVKASHRNKHGFYSSELLQLNHYYTRSEEDFLLKASKGHILNSRSSRYKEKLLEGMWKIDSDVIVDLSAINYLRRLDAK